MLVFLAAFVLWIGFYPGPLLNVMDRSVSNLLVQVERGRLKSEPVVKLAPYGNVTFDEVSRGAAECAENAK
jgi:hypothetical protein